jgi:hypothetical protein
MNNSRVSNSTIMKPVILEEHAYEHKIKEIKNLHHEGDYMDLKNEFEERDLLKNLKKYIKKAFINAKSIEIFGGRRSPILKFQYLDSSRDNMLKIRSLGDLLKANKELGIK